MGIFLKRAVPFLWYIVNLALYCEVFGIRSWILYILMLKPSYRDLEWEIWYFPMGLQVQHSGVHWEHFTRNSNFWNYQIYGIVDPSYCHLFNLTAILNLSCNCKPICFILSPSETNLMDRKTIVNLVEDSMRKWQLQLGSYRENILYI